MLMVNNLGGSPLLELYIAARAAHVSLEGMGCEVVLTRWPFVTSLEMQGMMMTVSARRCHCHRRCPAPGTLASSHGRSGVAPTREGDPKQGP